ncbi:lactosylceramide alpha-2,3-sialyltransferase isoform X2 [Festucalex cinctus]
MRLPKRWVAHRRAFLLGGVFCVLCLVIVSSRSGKDTLKRLDWHVDTEYKKLVRQHVHKVLGRECQPGSTRRALLARFPSSSHVTQPFLWKNTPLSSNLFKYPPPFGFRGLRGKVPALLQQLPEPNDAAVFTKGPDTCQRCVVIGNGGILKGLELGPFIDRFDTIIRLNSGPLGQYSVDVGNRTSIRMSYPEGTPTDWLDTDPETLFVAVIYKGVDVSWITAMINKIAVVRTAFVGLAILLAGCSRGNPPRTQQLQTLKSACHQRDGVGFAQILPTYDTLVGLGPECSHSGHLRVKFSELAV